MIASFAYGADSICTRTPAGRQDDSEWLARIVAESGIKPTVVPGFVAPRPMPARTAWIDPDARLTRRKCGPSAKIRAELDKLRQEHEDRMKLRGMADLFEGEE